ncbi:MAG: autoinducer binding domain-containing protein [Hyphomonadaceae bacterium]|nr:autoinducer binding domain-containing protein [Hyphomonadaceae bacterium]
MSAEFRAALEFIELAENSRDLEELREALEHVLQGFGVSHFTLARMHRPRDGAAQFTVSIRGVPEAWAEYYWSERFFNFDSVVQLSLQRPLAFSWTDIDRSRLSKASKNLYGEVRDALHVDGGFVIPTHDENGLTGLVALYHEQPELAKQARQALKLIALYGIERANELFFEQGSPPAPTQCPLSLRQREILAFAAAGKSETDTGEILGISSTTVREHLQNLRATLAVRTKMQAVAIAVHQGWIKP